MWILLIRKLPTMPSPPKLSIFWSVPYPNETYAKRLAPWFADYEAIDTIESGMEKMKAGEILGIDDLDRAVPNFLGARKIHYQGCDIRVFPNEFNPISHDHMKIYIFGEGYDDFTHEFIASDVAEDQILTDILEGDKKFIYDAALVDGATHEQAILVAMGMDITLPDAEFPPIGWYRCKPEYASYFCDDWEMIEDTEIAFDTLPTPKKKESRHHDILRIY